MPRKNVISVRLSDPGLKLVDEIAAEEERARSDMCRILISLGVKAWQQGKR